MYRPLRDGRLSWPDMLMMLAYVRLRNAFTYLLTYLLIDVQSPACDVYLAVTKKTSTA